jgi:hypothetical protein
MRTSDRGQGSLRLTRCRVYVVLAVVMLAGISGCASFREGIDGILGISIAELKKARKDAIVRNFNYDYFTCYTQTLDKLKEIRAYVYRQDIKRQMIAIYLTREDTTTVGIFFKEIDAGHTTVEVSSPSTYAKERISHRLFALLEGLPDPYAEEKPAVLLKMK